MTDDVPDPPGVILLLTVQLPATVLVGMASGVVAVRILFVRRGRVSLRANGVIVLLAALEAAATAPNLAAWPILLPAFLIGAAAMALVDLTILLELDARRPTPRHAARVRRAMRVAAPIGLLALGLLASVLYRMVALNPAGIPWLEGGGYLFILLTTATLVDAAARVIARKVKPDRG